MKTQSLSLMPLLKEESMGMIESVKKLANRSWKKSAEIFSGQKTLGNILVVDDNPNIRKLIRLILENDRYDVIEAEDGQDAIDLLRSVGIDAIITDLNMPKVDGYEVIAYCKREYPKIPLIVLTGIADLELATSFMRQGVTDYLVKPINAKELTVSVANAIAQQQLSWA